MWTPVTQNVYDSISGTWQSIFLFSPYWYFFLKIVQKGNLLICKSTCPFLAAAVFGSGCWFPPEPHVWRTTTTAQQQWPSGRLWKGLFSLEFHVFSAEAGSVSLTVTVSCLGQVNMQIARSQSFFVVNTHICSGALSSMLARWQQ